MAPGAYRVRQIPGGATLSPARNQTFLTPGVKRHASAGMVEVPRLVLIDVETGTRVRHRIRSIRQALKQQEWYETVLGRRVRIEKVFER